jgi:hypothetical protein
MTKYAKIRMYRPSTGSYRTLTLPRPLLEIGARTYAMQIMGPEWVVDSYQMTQ